MRKKYSDYLRYGTCLLMVSLFLAMLLLYFNVIGGTPGSGEDPDSGGGSGGAGDLPFIVREDYGSDEFFFKKEEREPDWVNKENNPGAKLPEGKTFLGVHNEKIAVFVEDLSGDKILIEILPYNVKNVYYEELKRGIPFCGEEEKMKLLENYTS
ncbi:MAG: hypothetical protein GX263_06885 [Firmicutes bacterium]|jgi:hypothetical protein|nr:hypothetical protein [Bacillota bacterium]